MSTSNSTPTNRLIDSTSPYLLQHARNPVDWYPWCDEAFEQARKQDKPVFLSIGYAACHWCHVMERESFEDEATAAILNEHFISIKVDREQRPDLDEIYMNATMLANRGQGGWPMSVFLTPGQKPFFAGTYFPAEPRHGMIGFKQLLERVIDAWTTRRGEVEQGAGDLAQAIERFSSLPSSSSPIEPALVRDVAGQLVSAFDAETGGVLSGHTNKFPPSMAMTLMLREYHRTRHEDQLNQALLDRVETTLDHMARGGIYDHLGGGIARYSTDPQWLVPHFEKMLYDQALVSDAYMEAYWLTQNARWADVAADIYDYVLADLQSPQGGFYSSRDADSEGEEGKFYVWSRAEIMGVLGDEVGELFCDYYNVTERGNWEGRNILHVTRLMESVARDHGVDPRKLREILAGARGQLLDHRARRVPPGLDDKILTNWNGLMIASLARGGKLLDEPQYVEAAAGAADFILKDVSDNGRLLHTYRKGSVETAGFLDDYAFFVAGLIELYEATFDRRWLSEARRLTDDMIEHFRDEKDGAFFVTADDAEELILRIKSPRDGAIPSGNSVALMNLLRLAVMLDHSGYREKADATIGAFSAKVNEQPFGFDRFLQAVAFRHAAVREVVVAGSSDDPRTAELITAVNSVYDPDRVVMQVDPGDDGQAAWAETVPLLRGKMPVDGEPAVYVCRNYTCRRPVTDAEAVRAELRAE